MVPKAHILSIRKKYTGENSTINSDGEMVVGYLTGMLSSAISELAENIYKKDSHFIMELIQNADDNEYKKGVIPTLNIIQDNIKVIFQNNEIGFKKDNIESICSIKSSTKGAKNGVKGYIGEKGIGFKSVFRVCNEPEIYSNGYQFKFNSNANLKGKRKTVKLGYILPEWIDEPNRHIIKSYTNIVLPFKESFSFDEKRRLSEIKPDLLLFLNKLKKIDITDGVDNTRLVVSKSVKNNIISLSQTKYSSGQKGKSTKKDFVLFERDNIKVPIAVKAEERKGINKTKIILAFPLDARSNLKSDDEQLVYSYLPIGTSGFRFLIQADFVLTSGRESIDEDNPWNQWVREEIAKTFKYAIEEFKKHPRYKYSFIDFIPYHNEIFPDFFQPLADEIMDHSQSAKIILSESGKWCKSDEVIFADLGERELFDNALLKSAAKKEYLSKLYIYNEDLFDTMQVETFSDDHIYSCLNLFSVLNKKSNQWFCEMLTFLSKRNNIDKIAKRIKEFSIIPMELSNSKSNQLAVPGKNNVFFPIDQEMAYSFEKSIPIISKDLFSKINELKNKSLRRNIIDLLFDLGIKRPTPNTIIRNFILKKYETDEWKSYKNEVLIDHLIYIKHHWVELKIHHDGILNLLKDKNVINCKSIGDGKNYFSTSMSVYISDCFKTKYYLEDLFNGIDNIWFINECYLNQDKAKNKNNNEKGQKAREWFNFFKALGCKEFPILTENSSEKDVIKLIDAGKPEKTDQLLLILEKNWNEYRKHIYLNNKVKKEWYKKLTENKVIPVRKKMFYASEIYIKNEKNYSFFGNTVTFFPRNILPDFAEKLGFNVNIDSVSVIRYLKELSAGKLKPSKDKAVHLYKFLLNDDNASLSEFETGRLIYLPGSGNWYKKEEVFWSDYQSIFGSEYGYCEKSYPLSLKEFFVDQIGINEKPEINHFINFLEKVESQITAEGLKEPDKEIIYKIYAELGTIALNAETEEKLFSDLGAYIWTNKLTFWANDNNIFYNDSDELFELFKDEESVAFFNIPKNILPKTKVLLSILKIPAISVAMQTELLNTDNATLDRKFTDKVRKYADSITSLIYSEHTYFYEQYKESGLFENMRNIEIYESPELEVKYCLNTIIKVAQADSFHTNNRIYISRDNNDKISTLAFEISKLLGLPQLFEFILLLITSSKSTIDFILKQKNIVQPPDESPLTVGENVQGEFVESEYEEYEKEDMSKDSEELIDDSNEIMGEESLELAGVGFKNNISTEKWNPEIDVSEISVEIESYSELADDKENEDKEGRIFSKRTFNTFSDNNSASTVLSKEQRDKIGDYGEEKVFLELIKYLKGKYQGYKTQQDNSKKNFQILEEERIIVELKWLNSKSTIQEGYDLILTENSIKKYYEVKTTRGTESIVFSVSPQQWKFIKLKAENYSIIRVINAGTENIRLIEINNPHQLWIDGKLKVYPINIEL